MNNLFKILSIASTIMALGCSDNEEKNIDRSVQDKFCEVISNHREQYNNESDKDFYLDQKDEKSKIFQNRKQNLQNLLADGNVTNWVGVISSILPSDEGAYLTVKLSCDVELRPNDSFLISKGSALYENLKGYSENSEITFSGKFQTPKSEDILDKYPYESFYSESSFSKSGSMEYPEFYFQFSDFKK